MKKAVVLAVSFFALVCILSSCKKDDKTSTLKGRDAIVGSYNFTNTYTLVTNYGNGNPDTTHNTETYVITIDKPEPDNLGDNILIIRNLSKSYPSTIIAVEVSSDGTVLSPNYANSEIYFDSFQGLVNGNTITFNFFSSPNEINEESHGVATRR